MKNLGLKKMILAIVILAVVVALVIVGISKWRAEKSQALNGSSYYAVFLNNDQVYFGHLSNVNDSYLSLTGVYYFKLAKSAQSTSTGTANDLTDNNSNSLTLVKLGSELHGPKDQMQINKENVLFFEELNDNSKVVQTIKQSTK